MIIDLHLNEKTVIIVGAGNEALKRIKLLESEGCKIIVIGEKPNSEITKLSQKKENYIKKNQNNFNAFFKKI